MFKGDKLAWCEKSLTFRHFLIYLNSQYIKIYSNLLKTFSQSQNTTLASYLIAIPYGYFFGHFFVIFYRSVSSNHFFLISVKFSRMKLTLIKEINSVLFGSSRFRKFCILANLAENPKFYS